MVTVSIPAIMIIISRLPVRIVRLWAFVSTPPFFLAAMPPPPPMGAAPMGAAPASGGHIRRGCSDLDIAASPPSGVPVGLVLPEAIPRVGQPLASVKSQDMSWPPSIGSMSGAGSETSLHSTPCA